MAKYVNLDKIIAKLEKAIEEHKADISEENAITAWIFKRFIAELEKVPTVDVVPVKHGHWVKEKPDVLIHWHCSVCKNCYYLEEPNANYCPNCGAKMDGGEQK